MLTYHCVDNYKGIIIKSHFIGYLFRTMVASQDQTAQLRSAATCGNLQTVTELLNEGVNVNTPNTVRSLGYQEINLTDKRVSKVWVNERVVGWLSAQANLKVSESEKPDKIIVVIGVFASF